MRLLKDGGAFVFVEPVVGEGPVAGVRQYLGRIHRATNAFGDPSLDIKVRGDWAVMAGLIWLGGRFDVCIDSHTDADQPTKTRRSWSAGPTGWGRTRATRWTWRWRSGASSWTRTCGATLYMEVVGLWDLLTLTSNAHDTRIKLTGVLFTSGRSRGMWTTNPQGLRSAGSSGGSRCRARARASNRRASKGRMGGVGV